MISQSRVRPAIAVLLLSSALLAPSAAHGQPAPPAALDKVVEHGFGDPQNSYAWSMAWFKGKLYVGTGRNVMCVETAVTQYYFPSEPFYTTQPALNVRCPANRYDLDLRAEIWQYAPRTGRWRRVYQSPADTRNPRARRKFLARDIAFRGMKVMRDRHGREALFIGGVTANEYVPENARAHPPRLLRTYDGKRFHDISVPLVVRRSGQFIDRRPVGYRGLEVVGNRLYVVASTALTGDGAVFEVRNPFGRKGRFKQVTPRNMHVFELQKFDRRLYVGTGSYETGFGVYKIRRTSRAPYRFRPVVTNGAGVGRKMVSVVSMYPFRGHLYVGAVSWFNAGELPASELIRIGHGGQWELVTGDPRPGPDGQVRNPISGLPAGFGNVFNSHLWRMVEKDGTLYVGTLDWTWLLQDSESWAREWAWLVDSVLTPEYGFDLWASCDGVDWVPVTKNAFNGDPYDFGVRTLAAGRSGVFIGSANHAFGTQIWRYTAPVCGSSAGADPAGAAQAPRQGAAEAPRHLLTDAQRDGTVVSWEPARGAVRYRVERAEYVEAPLSMWRSPRNAHGFLSEAALPRPAPRGAPGSIETKAAVQQPPEVLGTTTRFYFVDRTRQPGTRYVYQVFAETMAQGRAVPSNIQIVPDPRPPATLDQLDAAASGLRASAAEISQLHRLRQARQIQRLRRVARTATDARVRQLAYRVARRLEYQGVAGGPAEGG